MIATAFGGLAVELMNEGHFQICSENGKAKDHEAYSGKEADVSHSVGGDQEVTTTAQIHKLIIRDGSSEPGKRGRNPELGKGTTKEDQQYSSSEIEDSDGSPEPGKRGRSPEPGKGKGKDDQQ
ncbi:hypothetical protein K440DRAFT_661551 [Wilcoxina mikolae CBS 423.85]|nr:hypothetical protein K440DRAFT_661551 [Wilcoxina mikolae CBS 423.85]